MHLAELISGRAAEQDLTFCAKDDRAERGFGSRQFCLLAALSRLLIVPNGWLIKKGGTSGYGRGRVGMVVLENEQQ